MPRPETRLQIVANEMPLADLLAAPPGQDVRLWWLGQAGFVIDGDGRRVVIDPYLSDSLAEKYQGTRFPHTRMMDAPVAPDSIHHVDLVLATHAHTDHLDPGTLPALMSQNPQARLVAPIAAQDIARERAEITKERLIAVDAGQKLNPLPDIELRITRAAHEDLRRDNAGHHYFLGIAISLEGTCIFHSGDTIPFNGQVAEIRDLNADLALFPVNGRDALRAQNGVPGNLHISEALDLAHSTGIGTVIAHHFDLFEFNTVSRVDIEKLARAEQRVYLTPAQSGVTYKFSG